VLLVTARGLENTVHRNFAKTNFALPLGRGVRGAGALYRWAGGPSGKIGGLAGRGPVGEKKIKNRLKIGFNKGNGHLMVRQKLRLPVVCSDSRQFWIYYGWVQCAQEITIAPSPKCACDIWCPVTY